MPAKKSPSKRKRPTNQKAGGGCPGATCSEFAGIQALIQIREALGDPCGKLMQDELVDKVLNLIQGEKELREGVIQYIKRREDDGEDECVDELKYLLDSTQWWDWDIDTQNASAMAPATLDADFKKDAVAGCPSAPSAASRWMSMDRRPARPGTVWIKGTRKNYCLYFDGHSLVGVIPGWETKLGWRRSEPNAAVDARRESTNHQHDG